MKLTRQHGLSRGWQTGLVIVTVLLVLLPVLRIGAHWIEYYRNQARVAATVSERTEREQQTVERLTKIREEQERQRLVGEIASHVWKVRSIDVQIGRVYFDISKFDYTVTIEAENTESRLRTIIYLHREYFDDKDASYNQLLFVRAGDYITLLAHFSNPGIVSRDYVNLRWTDGSTVKVGGCWTVQPVLTRQEAK